MEKLETTLQAQEVLEHAVALFYQQAIGNRTWSFDQCLLAALHQKDYLSWEQSGQAIRDLGVVGDGK